MVKRQGHAGERGGRFDDVEAETDEVVVGLNRFTTTEPSPLTADLGAAIQTVDADVEEAAVESVRRQSSPDWEIVIADNASGMDVAGYVAGRADPRVVYRRSERIYGASELDEASVSLHPNYPPAPAYGCRREPLVQMFQ